MPFLLDYNPSNVEISDAVNYLLANLSTGYSANDATGEVIANGKLVGYLYKYIYVKYADSADGKTNFSNIPTNRLYYGTRNSNSGDESTNPSDYIWHKVTDGFGTLKYLWYQTIGGRMINFSASGVSPGVGWVMDSGDSIDLDIVTAVDATGRSFLAAFNPTTVLVPSYNGTPDFTGVNPAIYGMFGSAPSPFVAAQTDTDASFVKDSWRIGASATTGNADIVKTNITIGNPIDGGGYAVFPQPTAMTDPANIKVPIRYKNSFGVVTQANTAECQLSFNVAGAKTYVVTLYQWNTSTPLTNPSGFSYFNWLTLTNSGYTGGGGWQTSVPTNPGTPLVRLYVAEKSIIANSGDTSTTVSWASGYTVYDASQNGANGVQTARPTVYRWLVSIPSISGSTTYSWSTGSYSAPLEWSTSITAAPSPGYTLWAATVPLTAAATDTVTTINWGTASIVASGYSSSSKASARTMYARIAGTYTPNPGSLITVSGDNKPSGAQITSAWGASFNVTWDYVDPSPTSTNNLYMSEGVYDGANTTWGAPFLTSLKVGSLSATSANTGQLTVNNALIMSSSGYIIGGKTSYVDTTPGYFLGYSSGYVFNVGDANNWLKWTGSYIDIVTKGGSIQVKDSSGNALAYIGSINGASGTIVIDGRTYPAVTGGSTNSTTTSYFYNTGSGYGLQASASNNYSIYATGTSTYAAICGSSSVGVGIRGDSSYASGKGVYGVCNDSGSSSASRGVYGESSGGQGIGVYGIATAVGRIGTYGFSSATSGTGIGVGGEGNSASGYDFYAAGAGANYGPFTGSHDGLILKTQSADVGDILCDVQVINKKNVSNSICQNTLTTTPKQKGCVGVFVARSELPATVYDNTNIPAALVGDPNYESYVPLYDRISMNAVGEGLINVCNEGGDIGIGDYICSSSIAGKGMKQDSDFQMNYTIAKSREQITWDVGDNSIKQISCIYLAG